MLRHTTRLSLLYKAFHHVSFLCTCSVASAGSSPPFAPAEARIQKTCYEFQRSDSPARRIDASFSEENKHKFRRKLEEQDKIKKAQTELKLTNQKLGPCFRRGDIYVQG